MFGEFAFAEHDLIFLARILIQKTRTLFGNTRWRVGRWPYQLQSDHSLLVAIVAPAGCNREFNGPFDSETIQRA